MSPPRDERGRFVRADAKPVLHRQVDAPDMPRNWPDSTDDDIYEWAREGQPKPSLWPWLFLVGVLALVITGMFSAAVDGGLM